MARPVYKIVTEAAFREAERAGHFAGSADDLRDGFIHLSAAHQLEGTLAKHFAGQDGLLLVAVDPARLGPELSRDGAPFPHLYAKLDLAAVLWTEPLSLGEGRVHRLPEGVLA